VSVSKRTGGRQFWPGTQRPLFSGAISKVGEKTAGSYPEWVGEKENVGGCWGKKKNVKRVFFFKILPGLIGLWKTAAKRKPYNSGVGTLIRIKEPGEKERASHSGVEGDT